MTTRAQDNPVATPERAPEPQHLYDDPVARLAELNYQLSPVQQLCTELSDELRQIDSKQNAAKELVKLTEGLAEHTYEHRSAEAALVRLADEKCVAEDRLTRAKRQVAAIQAQIGQLDQKRIERLRKVHALSIQIRR